MLSQTREPRCDTTSVANRHEQQSCTGMRQFSKRRNWRRGSRAASRGLDCSPIGKRTKRDGGLILESEAWWVPKKTANCAQIWGNLAFLRGLPEEIRSFRRIICVKIPQCSYPIPCKSPGRPYSGDQSGVETGSNYLNRMYSNRFFTHAFNSTSKNFEVYFCSSPLASYCVSSSLSNMPL